MMLLVFMLITFINDKLKTCVDYSSIKSLRSKQFHHIIAFFLAQQVL